MIEITRKDIEKIYKLQKSLRYWQNRIAELQADIALSPKQLDGMPFAKTNKTSDPTQEKAIKLAELSKIIDGKIAEIQIAICDAEEFIAQIEDPMIQSIVGYRCINNYKWSKIATIIGGDNSEESVRQTYHRFITNLK